MLGLVPKPLLFFISEESADLSPHVLSINASVVNPVGKPFIVTCTLVMSGLKHFSESLVPAG